MLFATSQLPWDHCWSSFFLRLVWIFLYLCTFNNFGVYFEHCTIMLWILWLLLYSSEEINQGGGRFLFVLFFALDISLVELKPQTVLGSTSVLGSVILSLARLLRVCPIHAWFRSHPEIGPSFYTEFEALSFWLYNLWDSLFTFQWLWLSWNLSSEDCTFLLKFYPLQPVTRLKAIKLRNTSKSIPFFQMSALSQSLPTFCLSTVLSGSCFSHSSLEFMVIFSRRTSPVGAGHTRNRTKNMLFKEHLKCKLLLPIISSDQLVWKI